MMGGGEFGGRTETSPAGVKRLPELIVPGFIEGHGHFLGLGESRMILDLSSAATWDEIVARVRKGALREAAGALETLATRRMRDPRAGDPSKPDDLTFVLYRPLRRRPARNALPTRAA